MFSPNLDEDNGRRVYSSMARVPDVLSLGKLLFSAGLNQVLLVLWCHGFSVSVVWEKVLWSKESGFVHFCRHND